MNDSQEVISTEFDHRTLEFWATKSCDLLAKQISAYRQKQSNSGLIISIQAFFIPFFLDSITTFEHPLIWGTLIPIGCLIMSTFFLLLVLKGDDFFEGSSVLLIDEYGNKDYKENLVYEVSCNRECYIKNEPVYNKSNIRYKLALLFTAIAIFTTVLLFGIKYIIQ